MKLVTNVAESLESGTYNIFVNGRAEVYFKTIESSTFLLDSILYNDSGTFIAKDGMEIKAIFTSGEVIVI